MVILQAGVRKMIAEEIYNRKKIEYHKLQELEQIRQKEEMALRKNMNAKKAKEEAERLHRVSGWLYEQIREDTLVLSL